MTSISSIGQVDALPRLIGVQHAESEDMITASIDVDPEVRNVLVNAIRSTPVSSDEVKEENLRDRVMQEFNKFHLEG